MTGSGAGRRGRRAIPGDTLAGWSIRRRRRHPARLLAGWAAALLAVAVGAAALASPALAAHPPEANLVYHGPRTAKVIALTFDDGWSVQATREIFGVLRRQHVIATFFPVAMDVERAQDLWRSIAAAGYPIGNHTKNHPDLTTLPAWRVRAELHAAQTMIEAVTGRPMLPVFRPPYGAWNDTVLQAAHDVGFDTALLWDVASADTAQHSSWLSILGNALGGRNGSIVLMHMGPSATPAILDQVIDGYRSRGFTFVTIPQLLGPSVAARASIRPAPSAAPCAVGGAEAAEDQAGGTAGAVPGGAPPYAPDTTDLAAGPAATAAPTEPAPYAPDTTDPAAAPAATAAPTEPAPGAQPSPGAELPPGAERGDDVGSGASVPAATVPGAPASAGAPEAAPPPAAPAGTAPCPGSGATATGTGANGPGASPSHAASPGGVAMVQPDRPRPDWPVGLHPLAI